VISQVCTYTGPGSVKHDDLLDTTTQALRLFMDQHIGPLTIDDDDEELRERESREAQDGEKLRENPYDQ
jgi:hypothetical protein